MTAFAYSMLGLSAAIFILTVVLTVRFLRQGRGYVRVRQDEWDAHLARQRAEGYREAERAFPEGRRRRRLVYLNAGAYRRLRAARTRRGVW